MAYAFQTFERHDARLVKKPVVAIQAKGIFSLNPAAHHLLGEPEAIEFLFDPDARVIGLRRVTPDASSAYAVRSVRGSGTYVISGGSFCKFHEIPTPKGVRYDARLEDDTLIIELNDRLVKKPLPVTPKTEAEARVAAAQARAAATNGGTVHAPSLLENPDAVEAEG